jgi:hypothetical protein
MEYDTLLQIGGPGPDLAVNRAALCVGFVSLGVVHRVCLKPGIATLMARAGPI